jgi:hypothetical protein
MRATKEWAELEKILAEFERLELGSEAMGLATNFANQVGWLGPGPCHGMACPARLGLTLWCVGCALRRGWHSSGTVSFVCGMLATDSYSQRGRRSQCEIVLDSILLLPLSPEAWGGSRFATANPRGKPGSAIPQLQWHRAALCGMAGEGPGHLVRADAEGRVAPAAVPTLLVRRQVEGGGIPCIRG